MGKEVSQKYPDIRIWYCHMSSILIFKGPMYLMTASDFYFSENGL